MNKIKYLLLFASCLFIFACASNDIRLLYPENANSSAHSDKHVVLVYFQDVRKNPNLGIKTDNSAFLASSNISDWVTKSLGNELNKLGISVSYVDSLEDAKEKSGFVVNGKITELWINQTAITSLTTNIKLDLELFNNLRPLFTEHLSASQNGEFIVSSSNIENILYNTLSDITSPAAHKILESMK